MTLQKLITSINLFFTINHAILGIRCYLTDDRYEERASPREPPRVVSSSVLSLDGVERKVFG